MNYLVVDFITENWLYILLGLLGFILLSVFVNFIYYKFFNVRKSFKENLDDIKLVQFTTVIDYEEKTVEKYYLYDQVHKNATLSLEEFFVKFDKANYEKFNNWLRSITEYNDFDKTRRIEIVMYDNYNSRSVYLVELENYIAESKRYFLNFKDITKTAQIQRRANKKKIILDDSAFFEKANDRLSVCDNNSVNYLVAIKFKEFSYATKELQSELLTAVNESIYDSIDEDKNDNDLLCLSSNGTLLLFSANIVNIKKYKKYLRQLLIKNSGQRNVIENRFNYTVTLVAGYTTITKEEKMTIDKTLEAEAAVDTLMKKSRFSPDKIQGFDENLKNVFNIKNNKLLVVERVITQGLFTVEYTPLVNVFNKKVNEYYAYVILPHAINMELEEFVKLAKQKSFRFAFYNKFFEKILNNPKYRNNRIYISFDYDDINRVIEAYCQNEQFLTLDICFCMSFSNATMQNHTLIDIEKSLDMLMKEHNLKLGIDYNTLSTVYLNTKIYKKAEVVLFSKDLIAKSLDTYENSFLLEIYSKLAATNGQEVIGLNVTSSALYEMLMHYNVSKVGGSFLTPYVTENNTIEDKAILKVLNDIENKKY